MWQDIILAIVNLAFGYALVPQVYHGFKTKKGVMILQTSIVTFIGLYIASVVFLSLNLYFSSFISLFNGTMWFILAFQRIRYR